MEFNMYVVRTFSGHENKVKTLLEAGLNDHEHLKSENYGDLSADGKSF